MASKFGYRLTKRAESDLDGTVSYIAIDLANPQAASDFVDKLLYNIEEARVFPENGSLVDNEFLQLENEQQVAMAFATCYERCAVNHRYVRQQYATIAYNYFVQ